MRPDYYDFHINGLPKFHQEHITEPRETSKELQTSFVSVKINVHDSIIRNTLGKNGIHVRVARHKLLLTKKKVKKSRKLPKCLRQIGKVKKKKN